MFNKKLLAVSLIFLTACSSTITIDNNTFKIKKTKEYLACIKPHEIEQINSIYLKNNNNIPVYLVEMYGSKGSCNLRTDEISFKGKKTNPNKEKLDILQNYKAKIYFNSNLNLYFKVTKINAQETLNSNSITIPYFVVMNNKENNTIIEQKNLSIKIKLPKEGSKIVTSNQITFNQILMLSEYNNIEILSGIYVEKQYN